jgi:aldehyde:ferredoxin oxidoreductase
MYGRRLTVDLTTGRVTRDLLPAQWMRETLGGSGLAARILYDALDPTIAPLDPRSLLLFITGPLTGTAGPTTGRFTICGRSPATGLWGESNIGGFVGPELRLAGVDVLQITGRAAQPVYLWIHNDLVELRPAAHLWGQADTYAAQHIIRAETGQPSAKVACIGRAGENGVPMAGILSDHGRLAARTGLGALMGSKNLKAVAVRGTGKIGVAREAEYRRLRVNSNKRLHAHNMTQVLHQTGTSGSADYFNYMGDMPVKYWTGESFDGASNIGGAQMAETILTGTTACQGCVIACGREVTIPAGPYATGGPAKGPEYETVCSFGSQLLVDDLAAITALGDRCDRLGLDTISAGNTIALAYLLFERGLLTPADTGGLALRWGDPAPCFPLLDQMAACEGFGALLARGSLALAEQYGVGELAVQVAGLEVPMHDPRAFSGQAIVYATSPRGACHNQGDYFMVELGGQMDELGIPMTERFTDGGKAHFVARHQYFRTVNNSLVTCVFASVPATELVELLNAAAGLEYSLEDMLRCGQRAWNLKRLYNLRLGWTRALEKLPKLLLQSLPGSGQEGHVPDMALMLREYYQAVGWDEQTGRPLPETLEQLGIG